MSPIDVLPWLNLLLPPLLVYVVRIEHRLTRLEAFREVEEQAARAHRTRSTA